jgi:hypothetical protein
MDEKAMEREEKIARFLIGISAWWERRKIQISNFIFVDILGWENPLQVATRVEEEVKNWNAKNADHCEICGHPELRILYWLNDPKEGLKEYECTRCHHKQNTPNRKLCCIELLKKRIWLGPVNQPRYELITAKEAMIICLIGLALCIWGLAQELPPVIR